MLKIFWTALILSFISACSNTPKQKTPLISPPKKINLKSEKVSIQKRTPLPPPQNTQKVEDYCRKISKNFLSWGWGHSKCSQFQWNHVRNSYLGDPLMWVVFGDEDEHKKKSKDVTMILCGVHGDEITPVKFCFDVMYYLKNEYETHSELYKDKLVVVSPIVSPDSYFKKNPSRTNARGVDINRNFPTKDWKKEAIKLWKHRYRSDPRRFPGKRPLSEPEVVYQVNLIKRYGPNKIISVHAPLTLLDYDGPEKHDHHHMSANQLLVTMSKQAKGYKILNYPFFPGSLGNYAGNERGIPTYTLELPNSDNRRTKEFWELFKEAIGSAISHSLTPPLDLTQK